MTCDREVAEKKKDELRNKAKDKLETFCQVWEEGRDCSAPEIPTIITRIIIGSQGIS